MASNRPPMKAAHEYATKKLIATNKTEWDALVLEYLTDHNWRQESKTVTRWKQAV